MKRWLPEATDWGMVGGGADGMLHLHVSEHFSCYGDQFYLCNFKNQLK